jgi:pimeloyl-ACP methyl ester carboxylesterase
MLGGRPVRGDQDALCRVIKLVQPSVLSARLREVRELRLAKKSIDLPAIYIRAADDNLLPPDAIDGVRALVPAVKVFDVEGPHLVLDTSPEICARLVDEFVSTLTPSSPAR